MNIPGIPSRLWAAVVAAEADKKNARKTRARAVGKRREAEAARRNARRLWDEACTVRRNIQLQDAGAQNKLQCAEQRSHEADHVVMLAANNIRRAAYNASSAISEHEQAIDAMNKAVKRCHDKWAQVAAYVDISKEDMATAKIVKDGPDAYHIYYGGVDKPDGIGHGHLNIDHNGKVTHHRKPFSARTDDNFADNESLIDYRRSKGDRGGWQLTDHTHIDGKPVTYIQGWGDRSRRYLFAPGHIRREELISRQKGCLYFVGSGPLGKIPASK